MAAHRIVGLASGAVDTGKKEIQFALVVADRPPIPFVTEYGPASQFIGALGRMFLTLQEVLESEKKGIASVAAEQIAVAHIQQDRWTGNVIFQVTTPTGIPYNFVMPSQVASDIADRLKTESAKPYQTGTA
jgi:hypothetical protein